MPHRARLILDAGVGGSHVIRVEATWSDDRHPAVLEYNDDWLLPEERDALYAIMQRIVRRDPSRLQLRSG